MKIEKTAERLIEAIHKCSCSFTTAKYVRETLAKNGFEELRLIDEWDLQRGGKYYLNIYDSGVIAFTVGTDGVRGKLRVAACHTDQPALYIKQNPEMMTKEYGKLNVEVYGGPILNTWLDRPLSVAGKVALKSDDIFKPKIKIVDFERPLFTIPNLAIHLNKEVNKGMELNKQTDMQPLCAILTEEMNHHNYFMEYLAEELDVQEEDILDFELYVYNADEGCVFGMQNQFISAPRLDNITSVQACLEGILASAPRVGVHAAVFYDNEEIGSRTKQGADCALLSMILEKVYLYFGMDELEYYNQMLDGFLLSVDVAHALHPNKSEKADPTNTTMLNEGIAIKRSSAQNYLTDCESIAILEQICREAVIPYQKYSGRSDVSAGSTLGSMVNKYLPMHSADIGIPILSMHSARETMGMKDQAYLEEMMRAFYKVGLE